MEVHAEERDWQEARLRERRWHPLDEAMTLLEGHPVQSAAGTRDCDCPEMTTSGMTEDVRELALTIWNYHRLNHPLRRADAILVLCSHDTAVAERGASLFLDGWAPLLIYSGGQGAITRQLWNEPEAELFARIAVERGRARRTGSSSRMRPRIPARTSSSPGACSPSAASTRPASSWCRSPTWSGAASPRSAGSGPRKT